MTEMTPEQRAKMALIGMGVEATAERKQYLARQIRLAVQAKQSAGRIRAMAEMTPEERELVNALEQSFMQKDYETAELLVKRFRRAAVQAEREAIAKWHQEQAEKANKMAVAITHNQSAAAIRAREQLEPCDVCGALVDKDADACMHCG